MRPDRLVFERAKLVESDEGEFGRSGGVWWNVGGRRRKGRRGMRRGCGVDWNGVAKGRGVDQAASDDGADRKGRDPGTAGG